MSDFAEEFAAAVKLVIDGKDSEAAQKLKQIPNPQIQLVYPKKSLSCACQAQIFQRDRFTCRYCGRRTVLLPLLRLMASRFPREFPYHPNWKMTECHIEFWRVSSCDHLIPVARGGSSEPDNLVTACYMCNSIKQNWLLEELGWIGWVLRPTSSVPWDGLSALYLELLKITPSERSAFHLGWKRALEQHPAVTKGT